MPAYLGYYQNCASNRPAKFQRAVQSFLDQPYENKELIIVADGCKETLRQYSHYADSGEWPEDLVKLVLMPKQDSFSGKVRNGGLFLANGDIISYLDSDDMLFGDHLGNIARGFGGADWVYFNDYSAKDAALNMRERETKLVFGWIGTSSIAHRRQLDITWKDGYGHDWEMIRELIEKYPNNAKIVAAGYLVCHLPAGIDY